jgi:hypothetical protein
MIDIFNQAGGDKTTVQPVGQSTNPFVYIQLSAT